MGNSRFERLALRNHFSYRLRDDPEDLASARGPSRWYYCRPIVLLHGALGPALPC